MSEAMNENLCVIEAAIFAASEPLPIERLRQLFAEDVRPTMAEMKCYLQQLSDYYQHRGIELAEVATGYRFQVGQQWSSWLSRLWEKRPPRYSRALLETLALIVYRQPMTRAEIEDVRGVVVSSNIIRTLLDREWIKVAGYRDTPGKPALFATSKQFLDDFNIKSLTELPVLKESNDLEEAEQTLSEQLHLHMDTNDAIAQALQPVVATDAELETADSNDMPTEQEEVEQTVEAPVLDAEIAAAIAEADDRLVAINSPEPLMVVDILPEERVDEVVAIVEEELV